MVQVPFKSPIELSTNLDQDELLKRLSGLIARPAAFWSSRGDRPLNGSVTSEGCRLRYRTFYSNSFQRSLTLKFIPQEAGTRLVGEFGVSRWVLIFMAGWFVLLGLFAIVWTALFFSGSLKDSDGRRIAALWVFQPWGMLIFGWGLTRFGVWLSHFSEHDLLSFMRDTLDCNGAFASRIR